MQLAFLRGSWRCVEYRAYRLSELDTLAAFLFLLLFFYLSSIIIGIYIKQQWSLTVLLKWTLHRIKYVIVTGSNTLRIAIEQ